MEEFEALAWTSLGCYTQMLMGCSDDILENNFKRNVIFEGPDSVFSEGNKVSIWTGLRRHLVCNLVKKRKEKKKTTLHSVCVYNFSKAEYCSTVVTK